MKPITSIAFLFLVLIAAGHLVRAVGGWTVTVDAATVPVWVSAVASPLFAVLAVGVWREARR